MTAFQSRSSTRGSKRRGQSALSQKASPRYIPVSPVYMGFLLNRYGPTRTREDAGRLGITAVRARQNKESAQATSPPPRRKSAHASIRATAERPPGITGRGQTCWRRAPTEKPRTNTNGGGKGTPGPLEWCIRVVSLRDPPLAENRVKWKLLAVGSRSALSQRCLDESRAGRYHMRYHLSRPEVSRGPKDEGAVAQRAS